MIHLKIDRSTIRKNPDSEPWQQHVPGAKTIHFEVKHQNLIKWGKQGPYVGAPGWVEGANYVLTQVDIAGEKLKAVGVGIGSALLDLQVEGIEMHVETEAIQVNSKLSGPEYLYQYEPLPERITCPRCESSFKSENIGAEVWLDHMTEGFDDTLCPVCKETIVEYEKFNPEMV